MILIFGNIKRLFLIQNELREMSCSMIKLLPNNSNNNLVILQIDKHPQFRRTYSLKQRQK